MCNLCGCKPGEEQRYPTALSLVVVIVAAVVAVVVSVMVVSVTLGETRQKRRGPCALEPHVASLFLSTGMIASIPRITDGGEWQQAALQRRCDLRWLSVSTTTLPEPVEHGRRSLALYRDACGLPLARGAAASNQLARNRSL